MRKFVIVKQFGELAKPLVRAFKWRQHEELLRDIDVCRCRLALLSQCELDISVIQRNCPGLRISLRSAFLLAWSVGPSFAHCCCYPAQHMLFLGTEKYPDENSYSAFLNQHGGNSNAYTASEYTVYYFDVQSQFLLVSA